MKHNDWSDSEHKQVVFDIGPELLHSRRGKVSKTEVQRTKLRPVHPPSGHLRVCK